MRHLSDTEVKAAELQVQQIRSRVEALLSLYKAGRQERRQLQNYQDDVSRKQSKNKEKVRSTVLWRFLKKAVRYCLASATIRFPSKPHGCTAAEVFHV
jgi:hypothetical protein